MSQYLAFTLKSQADPKTTVDLQWFGTTLARQISSLGIFQYTSEDTKLSKADMTQAINTIAEEIKSAEKSKMKKVLHKEEQTALLSKCINKETFNALLEHIQEHTESIEDWNETIEVWKSIKHSLEFVSEVMEENEETWDLYYYNA